MIILAAVRRKRLVRMLDRAFWRTAVLSMKSISRFEHDPWWDVNGDLHETLRSLERGEPVDAPLAP